MVIFTVCSDFVRKDHEKLPAWVSPHLTLENFVTTDKNDWLAIAIIWWGKYSNYEFLFKNNLSAVPMLGF